MMLKRLHFGTMIGVLGACLVLSVTMAQDNQLTVGSYAIVNTTRNDTLNVRENAGINFRILERLADGTRVMLLAGPVSADGYSWWQVETPRGTIGWSVESADGIRTLIAEASRLDFISISEFSFPGQIAYSRRSYRTQEPMWSFHLLDSQSHEQMSFTNESIERAWIENCEFSPDGRFLALGFSDLPYTSDLSSPVVAFSLVDMLTREEITTPIPIVPADYPHPTWDTDPWFFAAWSFGWMPDSKQIVFSGSNDWDGRHGGSTGFWLRDVITGEITQIVPPLGWAAYLPKVSPDGRYVAFHTSINEFGSGIIDIVDLDSSQIVNESLLRSQHEWSPTENKLLIYSFGNLYTIEPGDEYPIAITDGFGEANFATNALWSPDGRYIVFGEIVGAIDNPPFGPTGGNFISSLLDIETGTISSLLFPFEVKGIRVWSPDSQYLIVQGIVEGQTNGLWIVSIDGEQIIQLDEGHNVAWECVDWGISPDSDLITETTPHEYALMSRLAYEPDDFALRGELRAQGWFELERSDVNGNDDAVGYFGIAFRNIETGDVVIAHRGTNQHVEWVLRPPSVPLPPFTLSQDWLNNIELALGGEPQQYSASAAPFLEQVCAKLLETGLVPDMGVCRSSVKHTGHSLGGFLAELSAYRNNTSAIVFDSPGAGYLILAAGDPGSVDIVNYVGPPNAVNTANPHVGQVILVDPDWCALRSSYWGTASVPDWWNGPVQSFSYLMYTPEAHSLTRIMDLMTLTPNPDMTGRWLVGGDAGLANFRQPDPRLLRLCGPFISVNAENANGAVSGHVVGSGWEAILEIKNDRSYWVNVRVDAVGRNVTLTPDGDLSTSLMGYQIIPPNGTIRYRVAFNAPGQTITALVDVTPATGDGAREMNLIQALLDMISLLGIIDSDLGIDFLINHYPALRNAIAVSPNFQSAATTLGSGNIYRFFIDMRAARSTGELEVLASTLSRIGVDVAFNRLTRIVDDFWGGAYLNALRIIWNNYRNTFDLMFSEPAGFIIFTAEDGERSAVMTDSDTVKVDTSTHSILLFHDDWPLSNQIFVYDFQHDETQLVYERVQEPIAITTGWMAGSEDYPFSNARLSPDGQRILFSSMHNDNNSELYTINTDGTNLTRLTTSREHEYGASWSDDGTEIAYASLDARTGNVTINVMNSYETRTIFSDMELTPYQEMRQFWDGSPVHNEVRWAANDEKIVFSTINIRCPPRAIRVISASGPMQAPVVMGNTASCSLGSFDISPDSLLIAFADDGTIHIADTNGNVIGGRHIGGSPVWSNDGSRIAYVGYTPDYEATSVTIMDRDGQIIRQIVDTGGQGQIGGDWWKQGQYIAWSPDDTMLAFSMSDGLGNTGVQIVTADGTEVTHIATPHLMTYIEWGEVRTPE